MPPSGSPTQSNAGHDYLRKIEDYYSNEDVAILHDIIVLAQALLPTLPERERLPTGALFNAYHDILPRIGIDVDHDSRYARILFKIGGLRGPGTLYEKFEEVLSKMGIEIELDGQYASEQGSQFEDSQTNVESSVGDASHPGKQRRNRRRNSEGAAWVSADDIKSVRGRRRDSHSTGDKITNLFGHTNAVQDLLPSPNHPAKSTRGSKQRDNALHLVGTWLGSRPESPKQSSQGRSISVHGSMRIRRRSSSRGRPPSIAVPLVPESNDYHGGSELTANTSYSKDDNIRPRRTSLPHHSEKPAFPASESLMQVKASVVLQDHLKFLAKQQIRFWRDKAIQLREDTLGLNFIATHFNRKVLSRAVFEVWREQAVDLRKLRTTQAFFEHLEERATRARDLYLMHMAFTHWSTYANEQVRRTELARRHIVRTRIFNAWRDITAVNELKVRRQVLKKFFSLWKRQHVRFTAETVSALQTYRYGLVQRILRSWIHKLQEMKATAWWSESVKRRTLFHWIVASHEAWEGHRTAEEERCLKLTWNAWNMWRIESCLRRHQMDTAATHNKEKSCRTLLKKWRKEICVIPAKTIIQTEVAGRLLREAFNIWRQRTLQEKIAASVNRVKVLREALILWRQQGRAKVVTNFIADRMKVQTIYRFSIAHRSFSALKTLNQNRLREILKVWTYRWRQFRVQRWEQEDLARSFAVQRSQNLALAQWYSQMGRRKSLEVSASEYYEPRLLGGVTLQWIEKTQQQSQLQKWSKDAEFYFLATKALKHWKTSTESARRGRRKIAYAQVRRMIKMNLVRGVLQTWQDQARHIIDLQSQASARRTNRNVIIGMEIFDRWRGRTEELLELESLFRETAQKKQFIVWREKSEGLQALETEAIITYQDRRQSRAIKKWGLAALQLRAQSNYAADVCEKNSRKTFRKIFKYWHQKMLQRRALQRAEASESDQLQGTTARAETWSEYGEDGIIDEWARGLDEATSSNTIPGYLATPSKVSRAERVMAAAARLSTTPKAQLSTPFERQLRAQYSGSQFSSLRKLPGRSGLGLGGGFADIPEQNMNTGRESSG